jgi:hypothetical protein
MWNRLKESLGADIKIVTHSSHKLIVLLNLLIPVVLIFILAVADFLPAGYYSLIVITLVSVIPVISGIIFAFVPVEEIGINPIVRTDRSNLLYARIIISVFISFVLLSLTTILSKPVPSEGWLRNLFVIFLLAMQAPFVFLLITSFSKNKVRRTVVSAICLFLLIAAPAGVMMHHPWNYFTFFSPLYWIIWTWIVPSPSESLIYSSIAIVITVCVMILCLRHFLRNQRAGLS